MGKRAAVQSWPFASSLRHVDFGLSMSAARPGNRSCVERIDGGQDTHLYKISNLGYDCNHLNKRNDFGE